MIPQTAGTLIAFLMLVAPGISFDLLRSRRRIRAKETTFREISRTALSSLLFTITSSFVLLSIGRFTAVFPVDLNQWIRDGNRYIESHAVLVGLSLLGELVLACLLAVALDQGMRIVRNERASLSSDSAWYESLRADVPKGATPWVHAKLTDGTSFYGLLRSYSPETKPEDRELSLEGVGLTQVDPL